MTIDDAATAIRAYLERERLVLCRPGDTAFALDGERESFAIREIAEAATADPAAPALPDEWDEVTTEVSAATLEQLRLSTVATSAHPRILRTTRRAASSG